MYGTFFIAEPICRYSFNSSANKSIFFAFEKESCGFRFQELSQPRVSPLTKDFDGLNDNNVLHQRHCKTSS